MRLSTRLLLFFLGALALVLLGFSTALYVMASIYLHRQVDERLEAVLNTLVAAAEVGPKGVEWEPQDARSRLATAPSRDLSPGEFSMNEASGSKGPRSGGRTSPWPVQRTSPAGVLGASLTLGVRPGGPCGDC